MKNVFLLLFTIFLSASLYAKELTIEAHKEQVREIIFEKSFPAAIFDGVATVNAQTGFKKYPTRFVIGVYEGSINDHAFRVVLEQIVDSEDKYWLLYEYVKNSEVVLRIELDSEIRLKKPVDFQMLWGEIDRVQIVINGTYHFPYLNMKTKTPFMTIRAGEANIDYNYRGIHWPKEWPLE